MRWPNRPTVNSMDISMNKTIIIGSVSFMFLDENHLVTKYNDTKVTLLSCSPFLFCTKFYLGWGKNKEEKSYDDVSIIFCFPFPPTVWLMFYFVVFG